MCKALPAPKNKYFPAPETSLSVLHVVIFSNGPLQVRILIGVQGRSVFRFYGRFQLFHGSDANDGRGDCRLLQNELQGGLGG